MGPAMTVNWPAAAFVVGQSARQESLAFHCVVEVGSRPSCPRGQVERIRTVRWCSGSCGRGGNARSGRCRPGGEPLDVPRPKRAAAPSESGVVDESLPDVRHRLETQVGDAGKARHNAPVVVLRPSTPRSPCRGGCLVPAKRAHVLVGSRVAVEVMDTGRRRGPPYPTALRGYVWRTGSDIWASLTIMGVSGAAQTTYESPPRCRATKSSVGSGQIAAGLRPLIRK